MKFRHKIHSLAVLIGLDWFSIGFRYHLQAGASVQRACQRRRRSEECVRLHPCQRARPRFCVPCRILSDACGDAGRMAVTSQSSPYSACDLASGARLLDRTWKIVIHCGNEKSQSPCWGDEPTTLLLGGTPDPCVQDEKMHREWLTAGAAARNRWFLVPEAAVGCGCCPPQACALRVRYMLHPCSVRRFVLWIKFLFPFPTQGSVLPAVPTPTAGPRRRCVAEHLKAHIFIVQTASTRRNVKARPRSGKAALVSPSLCPVLAAEQARDDL